VLCALLLSSAGSLLAAAKVESIGPLTAAPLSDELRQAVADQGYRVTLDGGWVAEFWFAKELKTGKNNAPGALCPELNDGEFVGIVNLPQGMPDYRGDKIAPGVYTLRYQSLPQDGNHMGVAPNPDFLLASPAADDSQPGQSDAYKKRIALSAKSTKTNHPAVIALESAAGPATVSENESGEIVFTVAIPSGGSEKLGIVVKGTAGQ
jgi:hypothetical protein